jgi:hypothetical protein
MPKGEHPNSRANLRTIPPDFWTGKSRPDRRTHGMTLTPEYRSWSSMKQRCSNPKIPKYHLYGGRGITICDHWRSSFANFFADMGPRPPGTTLDRIDADGHYEPSNCRWGTVLEQRHNRRPKADPPKPDSPCCQDH